MKFIVERDALLRALDHAQRIVLRKDAIAILSTVLISAVEGGVRIRASNCDMMAETGCPADVEDRNEGCIPLDPLFKLLQRLPAGSAMSFDGHHATGSVAIRCRRSRIELPLLAADDFPELPMTAGAAEVEIEGADFARLIGTPAFVAEPDSCYAFGVGVHVFPIPAVGQICGIATNGKRVMRVLLPLGEGIGDLPPVTVGTKAIAELVKLAKSANGAVRLRVSEHMLSAYAADVTITTKLVETRFPDCSAFFPPNFDPGARIASGELDAALNRALILTEDRYCNVQCKIADGSLSIQTRGVDGTAIKGSIIEDFEVEGGDGIGFSTNAKMIREALDAIGADVIELIQVGPGHPIAMRAMGSDEVVGLVMPTLG